MDTEDTQDTENTKGTQNTEDTKDTENTEDTEDTEITEDTENTKNTESTENTLRYRECRKNLDHNDDHNILIQNPCFFKCPSISHEEKRKFALHLKDSIL